MSLADSRKPVTDLFLFSHEVERGQSGAPVIDAATHQVVGLIEGRWLHPGQADCGHCSAVSTSANARRSHSHSLCPCSAGKDAHFLGHRDDAVKIILGG